MPRSISNTRLRVPEQFEDLLSYLTREVLRSQPENILEFCSILCEQL